MTIHRSSTWQSLTVLMVLLLLLAISVVAAHYPLGGWSSAVGLGIAAMKAALVAWYFMHLKDESSLIRVFSLAGVFCLAILLTLLSADYGDRNVERLENHQPAVQQPVD